MVTTLAIDCGGGGIKASVLDEAGTMRARPLRVPTPYPLPPALFVRTLLELGGRLPAADRVTVGMPGMIRHGVVVATPHYVTRSGPRSRVDPDLLAEWSGCDARGALADAFGLPALVLNDAEVHGAGVVAGTGCELVLTLGTGLGSALFDGGRARAAPGAVARAGALGHDLRHVRRRAGAAAARRRASGRGGSGRWSTGCGRCSAGTGSTWVAATRALIRPEQLARMGDDVVVVPNTAGIVGGVRAWELSAGRRDART